MLTVMESMRWCRAIQSNKFTMEVCKTHGSAAFAQKMKWACWLGFGRIVKTCSFYDFFFSYLQMMSNEGIIYVEDLQLRRNIYNNNRLVAPNLGKYRYVLETVYKLYHQRNNCRLWFCKKMSSSQNSIFLVHRIMRQIVFEINPKTTLD